MKRKNYSLISLFFVITLFLILAVQLVVNTLTFSNNIFYSTIITSIFITVLITIFLFFILKNYNSQNFNQFNSLENKYKKILESNYKYNIVSKATSDTIWDWDVINGSFIFNKGIYGIYGYKENEVDTNIDWWFSKIHPEDSLKMSVKLYSSVEQKTEKWQDSYRFQCANGEYRYISDRGFLIKDENDNVIRMIGAMQDVTKQKTEEQRLKLLEAVIIHTKDSVIITEDEEDSDTKLPKIVYVNGAFTKMTGFLQEEVIGKTPTVFMNNSNVNNDAKKLSKLLKKKEDFTFEVLNNTKNNTEYWATISMLSITDKENQHSHWISIQRDITEEKKKETEREQLISELTQNNKDLKQFSYITSHNLRAPLSNLTGLLSLIDDITIEDEELKEIINGFSKSTHVLNETINDLVKVIIIKDSPSIQKEEIIIKDVFENVFNQLSLSISQKKPIINLNFNKAEILNLNKSYLESIFLNLMTNALKYNDANKILKINVTSKIENENTVLTFSDNGIGIDLIKNKDKIFGLYQRFHNYPDSKGLGLYLVKSQVESMGGKISVESEVGVGTTFTIIFKNI